MCIKVDFTSFKVCKTCAKRQKKSAQSLQKVCKTSKKVCIFSANCTLCRLMHTFEKVCTNLPPDVSAAPMAGYKSRHLRDAPSEARLAHELHLPRPARISLTIQQPPATPRAPTSPLSPPFGRPPRPILRETPCLSHGVSHGVSP